MRRGAWGCVLARLAGWELSLGHVRQLVGQSDSCVLMGISFILNHLCINSITDDYIVLLQDNDPCE